MTTLVVKGNSLSARQFLEFVRTLPFVEVIEDKKEPRKKMKQAVTNALKKSEQGEDLIECKDADDMFRKLGI